VTKPESAPAKREPKKLTEVDALSRITKVLNQLEPNARRKVMQFLTTE
jgi:hypothetical protein